MRMIILRTPSGISLFSLTVIDRQYRGTVSGIIIEIVLSALCVTRRRGPENEHKYKKTVRNCLVNFPDCCLGAKSR